MMDFRFHIDEIFEIAEQLERNGADFYQRAAEATKEPEIKGILKSLAEMEVDHQDTFRKLRNQWVSQEERDSLYDPQGEAIQAEKDAIAFYLGMKEMLSDSTALPKIDSLIKEEMSHIVILSKQLKQATQ